MKITRPCHFCGKNGASRATVYVNDIATWECGMWEDSEIGACGRLFYSYGPGMLTKTFATFRDALEYSP